MNQSRRWVGAIFSFIMAFNVAAQTTGGDESTVTCPNAGVFGPNLIQNVCWSCVFPIRVAGVPISGSSGANRVPENAVNRSFCTCEDGLGIPHPGVVTSFWEPSHLVEFERTPGCLSALNGVTLPFDKTNRGTTGHDIASKGNQTEPGYRHYHLYAFPIMLMIDMFVPKMCNADGYQDIDIMFLSEVDPTWNNDELAFFAYFENALVASPAAAAACIPDAVAANTGHPIQSLWWCAGSWGQTYPLAGHINGRDGILTQTSVYAARMLTALHRRGFLRGTVGSEALCGGPIMVRIPKNQYRFSLFWPRPETDDNHGYGESVLLWGMNRVIPAVGEDPVYIIWRWLDCCNI